jgi:hypothetical protein
MMMMMMIIIIIIIIIIIGRDRPTKLKSLRCLQQDVGTSNYRNWYCIETVRGTTEGT